MEGRMEEFVYSCSHRHTEACFLVAAAAIAPANKSQLPLPGFIVNKGYLCTV